MTEIVLRVLDKLQSILRTVEGCILAFLLWVVDYFAGHSFTVFLVAAVTLMDAVFGIWVAVKNGRFALSELARLTIDKCVVYGCAMFVFVGLDKIGGMSITASLVGAAIVLVEFWSSCASMIILFPHIPLLRMLKKALTGEIAAKLNIKAEEVEDYLNGK